MTESTEGAFHRDAGGEGGNYRPDLQEAKAQEVVTASLVAPSGYTSATAVEVAVQPTQVRHPNKAALRTFVQTLLAAVALLGLVVPEVVDIILEETDGNLPDGFRVVLLAASAGVATIAAIVARIMAIPAVEVLLRRVGLASTPKEKTT